MSDYIVMYCTLEGILETLLALDSLSTTINPLVSVPELKSHQERNHNNKTICKHRCDDTRCVCWGIFSSENSRTNDTSETTEPD